MVWFPQRGATISLKNRVDIHKLGYPNSSILHIPIDDLRQDTSRDPPMHLQGHTLPIVSSFRVSEALSQEDFEGRWQRLWSVLCSFRRGVLYGRFQDWLLQRYKARWRTLDRTYDRDTWTLTFMWQKIGKSEQLEETGFQSDLWRGERGIPWVEASPVLKGTIDLVTSYSLFH